MDKENIEDVEKKVQEIDFRYSPQIFLNLLDVDQISLDGTFTLSELNKLVEVLNTTGDQ